MRARLNHVVCFFLGLFGIQASSAHADTYLCMENPDFGGGSQTSGYTDCIELLSWQWGMTNTCDGACPDPGEVSFTKNMGDSSPAFVEALGNGSKDVGNGILHQTRFVSPGVLEEYFKIELMDIEVTGFSDASTGELPIESVSIGFNQAEYCYLDSQSKKFNCKSVTAPP